MPNQRICSDCMRKHRPCKLRTGTRHPLVTAVVLSKLCPKSYTVVLSGRRPNKSCCCFVRTVTQILWLFCDGSAKKPVVILPGPCPQSCCCFVRSVPQIMLFFVRTVPQNPVVVSSGQCSKSCCFLRTVPQILLLYFSGLCPKSCHFVRAGPQILLFFVRAVPQILLLLCCQDGAPVPAVPESPGQQLPPRVAAAGRGQLPVELLPPPLGPVQPAGPRPHPPG